MASVVLLLPVHQPGEELSELVRSVLADGSFAVLVSDDGSGPEYDERFASLPPEVEVIRSEQHLGKGVAIKAGLRRAMELWPELPGVVTAEAHRGHSAENLRVLAEALLERPDAILLGARSFSKELPWKSQLGNWLVRMAFSGACSVRITDTQTDLRAYPAAILPQLIQVAGERYEYATNVLLWAAGCGRDIVEVDLPDRYDDVRIPKHFHPIRDSVRIFRRIFKFAIASFSGFCVDYVTVLTLRSLTSGLMAESLSLFVSVLAGRTLSGAISFTINRKMGFHAAGRLWRSALKYFTILFVLMAVNYWLLYVVHLLIGIPLWIAKMLVETCMFFANYALQTRLVFNPKKKNKTDA